MNSQPYDFPVFHPAGMAISLLASRCHMGMDMSHSIQKLFRKNIGRARKLGRAISLYIGEKPSASELPAMYRGTNNQYCKFVVLTHARTASSTMITMLNRHPNIMAFGEIFRADQISFNNEGFDNQSKRMMALRQTYPIDFIQHQIFPSYSENTKAVGFKLFPEQINTRSFRPIWDWIVANKSIRIILLYRENLLAYYTSHIIAINTKKFGIRNVTDRINTTINIDFDDCLKKFQYRTTSHRKILQDLKDHQLLEISYEELTGDMDRGFSRLQKFLGVEKQPLAVSGIKKEVRPLSTVIENYTELRIRFCNTEWQYLFNE